MTEIGRLIDAYSDEQEYRPNQTDIARRLGVGRSTVSKWYGGSVPNPEHLRALHELTRLPYSRLTDAVLVDLGYLPRAGEEHDRSAATKQAEGSSVTGKPSRRGRHGIEGLPPGSGVGTSRPAHGSSRSRGPGDAGTQGSGTA